MAFTYALSTDVGKLRLKLADTGGVAPGGTATSGYAFDDDELDAFLDEGGTVDKAAALGARVLLADAARRQRAFQLPGMQYDDRGRVSALKELLKAFGGELPALDVVMPALQPYDANFSEPA